MGFIRYLKSLFICSQSKTVSSERDSGIKAQKVGAKPFMRYLLNDPVTPKLTLDRKHNNRPSVCPPFLVRGYNGNQIKMWTPEWRSAQVHNVILDALHTMQPGFRKAPRNWPATNRLVVIPNAGRDLNAYYDRHRLCFFADNDSVTQKKVFTADSVDIVAHELGHALLDAARPDLWNLQALEVWSFHEAWADIVAMLTVMKHEKALKYVLQETNGDFARSNIVSRLGEEMGTALYHLVDGKGGYKPGALRDANNKFMYRAPEKLPKHAPDNKLARECHSFGRVFLGAFYEIMTKVYQYEVNDGFDQLEALKRTRHLCSRWLARGAKMAPATPRFYDAVARAMLGVDKGNGGKYHHILKGVFDRRRILSKRRVRALSSIRLDDIDINRTDEVEEYKDLTIVRSQSVKTMKLEDHFGLRAQADNPLYACEIEVPDETYMEFDASGKLVDSVAVSPRIAVNSARDCIQYLHENDMVAYGETGDENFDKQFSVVDNKLVRNFLI